MDTDQAGGQVYDFCRTACMTCDLLVYYGASGQDAGVEVGMASAWGAPILGIRGPLEAPGLMLHGAAHVWTETIGEAVCIVEAFRGIIEDNVNICPPGVLSAAKTLAKAWLSRGERCSLG